ncbi:MAG: TrkH family potassium uptake protein [Candidatus Cloacimonadaceae bacterium]
MLNKTKVLNFIEFLAYPIALWNILILFFEPVISHYFYLEQVQDWTAFANLLFLIFTLAFRGMLSKFADTRYRTAADLLILVFGSLLFLFDVKFVIFFLLIRQIFFIAKYFFFNAFEGAVYKRLVKNPPVTFLLSFATTILVGTVLLMLPSATVGNKVTPFINALFTSTSATCVTGLIVVDTGTYFSTFGQLIILVLIQVGGLGIMTISTAFAVLLGQRLTLRVENVMQNVMGQSMKFDMVTLVKNVVLVTLIFEMIGAAVFFTTFSKLYETPQAIYYSVFHSISAFCNAGFGLYSDSFVRFAFDVKINLILSLLIIIGGLGFPVIVDLISRVTKKSRRYSLTLHSKIVLSMTAFLLVLGMVAFFISEYQNTMKDFTIHQKMLTSWFQSVTCRTAGFNTLDQSQMSHSSSLVSMIMMFIGASPGSTGGGVKTTTFALLLLSIIAVIRGQTDLTIFKRKIGAASARQSVGLIMLSMISIFIIAFLILLNDRFDLEQTLFEALSAFGTVGLSMGITPQLNAVSKFLIIILMYIGRVGPLTVLFALSQRKKKPQYSLAEEKITIG